MSCDGGSCFSFRLLFWPLLWRVRQREHRSGESMSCTRELYLKIFKNCHSCTSMSHIHLCWSAFSVVISLNKARGQIVHLNYFEFCAGISLVVTLYFTRVSIKICIKPCIY